MSDILENAVVRIDIGIDYSALNDDEVEFLNKIIALGNLQLNLPGNNRLARITELKLEMKTLGPDETDRKGEITKEIREMRIEINNDKREGVYEDYGILKRRIAEGAKASEVYSMMPHFYAEAYNLNLQFSARNRGNDDRNTTSFIEEAPKWLTFLRSLSDFIRTFGGSV